MPRYRVTLSDGRVVTLDADTKPSEADVLAAIGGSSVNVGESASFTVNDKPASAEDFITPPAKVPDPGVLAGAWGEIGAPLVGLPGALAEQARGAVQTLGKGVRERYMMGRGIPNTEGGAGSAASTLDALGGLTGGPVYLMGKGGIEGVVDQAEQAVEAFRSGRWSEGSGRALASALPVLGPDAASIAEDLMTRPKYAMGRLAALLGTLGVPGLMRGRGGAQAGKAAATQQQATKLVTQALDPRKERWKSETAKIAPEVARRRTSGTLEQVASKADEAADVSGSAIEQFWSDPVNSELPIPAGRFVGEIEKSKEPFRNVVKDKLTGQPIKLVDIDPRVLRNLEELQQVIEAHGDTLSAANARKILQNWSEPVAEAGGYSHRAPGSGFVTDLPSKSELWAKREGASAVRQVLGESEDVLRQYLGTDHPDLRQLNREYSFQRSLRDIAESTLARTSSHRSRGLSARVAQAGGSAVGAALGMTMPVPAVAVPITAIIGGEAAARLAQVFDGPRWKLMQAAKKQALADALASGEQSRIKTAVGRILADETATGRGAVFAGKAAAPGGVPVLGGDTNERRRRP